MTQQVPTIIQVSLMDVTGDSYHRMRWPGQHLARQAPGWRVINLDFRSKERFDWGLEADLLVLLHCGDIELLPLIQKRKRFNKKTLIEINDNFYSPQSWNSARIHWDSPLVWKMYENLMNESDGVIVTGEGLRELLQDKAPGKIHILENHFPSELPKFSAVWREPKQSEFILGWAGSAGHMADLLFLVPAIKELLTEFSQLKIHLMGDPSTTNFAQLPADRLRFTPFGSIESYFQFLTQLNLGFIPLLDTEYNRCRSDVKAIEMAAHAVLPIIQKGVPYRKFISETQAPEYQTPEEFKNFVRTYIRDHSKLQRDAEKCFEYVREKRIGLHQRDRYELYSQFLSLSSGASFIWAQAPGYHEITGSLENQSKSTIVLQRVQDFWNRNERDRAFSALQTSIVENPFNSELAVAEVKCLLAAGAPQAREQIERYSNLFSADLRFLLLKAQTEVNVDSRAVVWKEILDRLSAFSQSHRRFFRAAVLSALIGDLRSGRISDTLALKFVNIFQNSIELHMALADAFEKAKEFKLAREHFQFVLQKKREIDETRQSLENIPDYVLEVWVAALESRMTS